MRNLSIDLVWTRIQTAAAAIGGYLGYFVGGVDGLMTALILFMVIDYITGLMCAIVDRKLSSEVGFKGICKKVLIMMLVGVAHIVDLHVEKDSFTRWQASQSKYREQRRAPAPRMQLRKPKNPAFYTVEEVCRFYGMRHAELYEKLQNGDLPAIRSGRTWRINRKGFDELLTGRSDD